MGETRRVRLLVPGRISYLEIGGIEEEDTKKRFQEFCQVRDQYDLKLFPDELFECPEGDYRIKVDSGCEQEDVELNKYVEAFEKIKYVITHMSLVFYVEVFHNEKFHMNYLLRMKIDTDNETIVCEEVEQGGYVEEIHFTNYDDKSMWK